MRAALPALLLGVALVGCSSGGDSGEDGAVSAPSSAPSHTPLPAASSLGPATTGSIPAGAFLAPADLGPRWSTAPAAATPCAPTYARKAVRSSGLTEPRGLLTETVATGVDVAAVVKAWQEALSSCGFAVGDDALGDAAVSARSADGSDAVVVTGTEGVLVVLHARGALARADDELEGWADLALGTSCVAAPDGCH